MTDEELIGIAAQAFNMARMDIKNNPDDFTCLIAGYHVGGGPSQFHRMRAVEEIIREKLGEGWLNSGPAKDAAFSILRDACNLMPPEAFVFVSATNVFQTTEKFNELNPTEREAMLDGTMEHRRAGVERGLMTIMDALTVTAQTPTQCCFYVQTLDARGEPVDQPRVSVIPQDGFKGRLKMFGSTEDQEAYFHDKLWHHRKRKRAM